jgi:hypothetical protein
MRVAAQWSQAARSGGRRAPAQAVLSGAAAAVRELADA